MQHQNNDITYKRFELWDSLRICYYMVQRTQLISAINKGFRYVDSGMKSYEQVKRGLSYVYHKRNVAANDIDTTPLDI